MNLTTRFTWQGLINKSLIAKKRRSYEATTLIILRSLSTVQRPQKDDINNNNSSSIETNKLYTYTKTDGYIRYSPFENITLANCTIDKYVWKNINQFQDKIAIMCGITGNQYTYKELRDYSAAFAIRLQCEMNLKLNDIIAVCLPNIPEYPIATLGAIEAGLIVTTINPIYTAEEISRQLLDSNCKLIIGTIDGYDVLKKAINIAHKKIQIICIKTPASKNVGQSKSSVTTSSSGAIDFYDLIKLQDIDFNQLKIYNRCANELAFLPYSSGTTGLPKGVMLSHNNITTNCEQIKVNLPYTPLIQRTTDTFQDVLPCILPFYHIYGFTLCMSSKLSLGCKLITYPRFQQDTFIKSIEEQQATILHVVPPIMLYLTNNNMIKSDHLKSVRSVVSGAAPIGQLDAERFIKKFPHIEIIQGYGLTETSSVVSMNFKDNKMYASVGWPASNTQIKIVKIDGGDFDGDVGVTKRNVRHIGLPANEIGEIFVRGPQCMIGYYKNKKANKTIMMANDWIRTGDIGYYNTDGYLYVTERLKELIKVKGFQVAPAELEELLRDHPMVDDVAVIGIPHLKYGEVPRAYIVLKQSGNENHNNNNNKNFCCNENEFKTYVAERVSNYKHLDGGIEFINKIPRNLSGKILRKQLRDRYAEKTK